MKNLLILHILFMTVAVILIIIAAVIAHGKKQGWLKKHKVFALLGVFFAIVGFTIIFFFKISMHFPHFHSIHAIVGICTFILLLITPIFGALSIKGLQFFRPIHRIFGKITSIAILITAFSGLMRFLEIIKK